MVNTSVVINYTKTKVSPPARAIEYEKSFPTMDAALGFCIQLEALGGETLYLRCSVDGDEEILLEGDALAARIARRRALTIRADAGSAL